MKFREAIHSGTVCAMERHPSAFLIGVGIVDPRKVYGTLLDCQERWPDRFVEGPLSENALTGVAMAAATLGMRPMLVHHRMDFMMLTMDQIVTHAAKWRSMFGNQQTVPLVIRAVVGRGWGNGPQHTQSQHGTFAHIPGIQVVVPANPYDAKGLLLAAVESDDPTIYIEHRWLHEDEGNVPAEYYTVPIGKAAVVRKGKDVTVVAVGPYVTESLKAVRALESSDISAEVVDLRTLRPLDLDTVLASVEKTGRLVVADPDWGPCGVAGEIIASVAERALEKLKAPPIRVTWPDGAVPMSHAIESLFYPGAKDITAAILQVCRQELVRGDIHNTVKPFEGPF